MDLEALKRAFRDAFQADPEIITVAPGRVNLIGEHTDYNDGFVFPAAIDRQLYVAARKTDGLSNLRSIQMGAAADFNATEVEPGKPDDWGQYAAGMAWAMRDHGRVPNVQAIVSSEVPIGSGVSSSAALELAFGVLYNELANLKINQEELAKLGQIDENQFVGVNSGIMDQMASALGKAGHALFLDTRSLDIQYAPIPEHLSIVLCDTKTPRALTSSAYNERRSQCEKVADVLKVKALRDATLVDLDSHKNQMSAVEYRRAKHVITENDRCLKFLDALRSNQSDQLGRLMQSSHESLRDDYEVSSRELDMMAEASWNAPGCVGARMTGAGFGGACVALVERNSLDDFTESVNLAYEKASGIVGEIFSCLPVDGARVLWRA
jgi:galactokinase